MRRVVVSVCASLLAVGLIVGPVTAVGPQDPFRGVWVGTETSATGTMPITVAFGGLGPVRHIAVADFCNSCDPPGYMSIALGSGVIDGDQLHGAIRYHDGGWATQGPRWYDPMDVMFTAQADGTLLWGPQLVLHRPGS